LQEKKNILKSFFQEKRLSFLQALEKRKGRQNRNKKIEKPSKIELPYYCKLYITLISFHQ